MNNSTVMNSCNLKLLESTLIQRDDFTFNAGLNWHRDSTMRPYMKTVLHCLESAHNSTNKDVRPARLRTSRTSDQQSYCSMFRSYNNSQKHVSRAGREIRSIAVGLRYRQSHADRVPREQWMELV
jgi:hypothetical protein